MIPKFVLPPEAIKDHQFEFTGYDGTMGQCSEYM